MLCLQLSLLVVKLQCTFQSFGEMACIPSKRAALKGAQFTDRSKFHSACFFMDSRLMYIVIFLDFWYNRSLFFWIFHISLLIWRRRRFNLTILIIHSLAVLIAYLLDAQWCLTSSFSLAQKFIYTSSALYSLLHAIFWCFYCLTLVSARFSCHYSLLQASLWFYMRCLFSIDVFCSWSLMVARPCPLFEVCFLTTYYHYDDALVVLLSKFLTFVPSSASFSCCRMLLHKRLDFDSFKSS